MSTRMALELRMKSLVPRVPLRCVVLALEGIPPPPPTLRAVYAMPEQLPAQGTRRFLPMPTPGSCALAPPTQLSRRSPPSGPGRPPRDAGPEAGEIIRPEQSNRAESEGDGDAAHDASGNSVPPLGSVRNALNSAISARHALPPSRPSPLSAGRL